MKKWVSYSTAFFVLHLFMGIAEASAGGTSRTWPWTAFFRSLAQEFTGPLPMVLGIFGIVASAWALFNGHGGDGARKGLLAVIAVSVAMTAGTIVNWISSDAGASASGIFLGGF